MVFFNAFLLGVTNTWRTGEPPVFKTSPRRASFVIKLFSKLCWERKKGSKLMYLSLNRGIDLRNICQI